MAYDTLREFIEALDAAEELIRITRPVRVDLEITEISDRCMKSPGGGPALLFEKPVLPDGSVSEIPVGINLFGSRRRMAMALGVERLDEIAERIRQLLEMKPPTGLKEKLLLIPQLAAFAKFPPRRIRGTPACQQVILRGEEANLEALPHLMCWPDDGGRYLTLPQVISRDPTTQRRNVGMYRVQVQGPRRLAMHWQRHKSGAEHWREMAKRGERMPVCIALGGDPASLYSGSAPLPPNIDEYLFAGFLRESPVEVADAVTNDLQVPADADIVIEGWIDPSEDLVMEGPFGDHTGFYSEADLYPLVHVEAITMRRDPIYPATIVGRPPMEDFYLGHATERIFLPLMQLTSPEVVDYHMPAEGIFHNLVFVAIRKAYPGHAYKVMHGLWGQGLMSLAKVLVVVDDWVDVQNTQEAWWVALNNIDPERDSLFSKGPIDVLDHSARAFTFGSKIGFDGTRKWPEEGFDRNWPEVIEMDQPTRDAVDAMWDELGINLE